MNEDLFNALIEVDTILEKAEGGLGAAPADPKERVRRAIADLKTYVCPHTEDILRISRSCGVEVAVLLTELLVFFLGGVPSLVLIGREIAEIGLEKFCRDPYGTLGAKVDVSE